MNALALVAALGLAQSVQPILNGVTVTGSGSRVVSGLFSGDVDLVASVGSIAGGGSIVFAVSAVDPLNPSGGAIATAATASISSATSNPAVAVLHAGHSSSVQVTWTVTGTFSATVWLSVQGIIPSEFQGVDGGMPVTVSTAGGGSGGSGLSWDAGVVVQNQPPGTTILGTPGFVCCGTSATAIPYSGTCLHGVNLGPNEVVVFLDGGTVNEGLSYPVGTANPQASPGGEIDICNGDAGQPLVCVAYTAAQTDGGCVALNYGTAAH